MTEKDRFVARFEEKVQKEGLKDIKFMVLNGDALSEDDFFSAANQFEDIAKESRVAISPEEMEKIEPKPAQLLQ